MEVTAPLLFQLSVGLLVADFSAMVNNPHLSDVQFQMDNGEVLYAHKFVLYARCPLLIQYVSTWCTSCASMQLLPSSLSLCLSPLTSHSPFPSPSPCLSAPFPHHSAQSLSLSSYPPELPHFCSHPSPSLLSPLCPKRFFPFVAIRLHFHGEDMFEGRKWSEEMTSGLGNRFLVPFNKNPFLLPWNCFFPSICIIMKTYN